MEENLPFLRPRSSRRSVAAAAVDPRTAAVRAMNAGKISARAVASHDESLMRSHRTHMSASAEEMKTLQQQLRGKHAVYRMAPPSLAPRPPSTAQQQQTSTSSTVLRNDSAHVWWPQIFDGAAFNSQLERLVACKSDALPKVQDAHCAFEALDLVADTLHGTPAAEIIAQAKRVLQPLVYRPNTSNGLLLRDLVMGLEVELEKVLRDLHDTQEAHRELRDATTLQVREANAKRISSDIQPALHSVEVAEATIARVQRESAEMATRMQQSLAQQQLVRAKLVDLGMRNMELRQVLEAQRRAATARSWEDVMPKAASGSSDGAAPPPPVPVLDRSALHILCDVVGSSQTELANLLEYRQRLSAMYQDAA